MDIINECLSLAPIPGLQSAFSALRLVYQTYTQVQTYKHQLRVLAESLAQLLKALNSEYRNGRLLEAKTGSALGDLKKLCTEVAHFTEKCAEDHFLKMVFSKDARQSQINNFHRRIDAAVALFKIAALVDIQDLQARSEIARVHDQKTLDERLLHIENNQSELRGILQEMMAQQNSSLALMASLCRRSQTASVENERRFFSQGAEFLSNISGEQVELENWTITSFDVEFGPEIGFGGFGQVFKGMWGKTEVALKVLKTTDGAAPSPNSVRHEVKIWSTLRHPNVLQFLGANILDGRPFIVTPYMKKGNVKDFILENPKCDRLRILHDMSLGLFYLHGRNIIHGDLKAANVLIDDSGKALLCDFGLARAKADATNRMSKQTGVPVSGSRNWMAPELLKGGSQRKPCDIYSFGMTIFEIYTNEMPLSSIDFGDFIELVVRNDVRPERPDDGMLNVSEDLWRLAQRCWAPSAIERPTSGQVCDCISQVLDTRPVVVAAPLPPTLVESPLVELPQELPNLLPNLITFAPTQVPFSPTTSGYLSVIRATHDFDAITKDEISIKACETLFLVQKVTEDWWRVKLFAKATYFTGLVPAAYVEPAKHISVVKGMYDFEATRPDELSFQEDNVLLVYEMEQGWLLAQSAAEGGKAGFIPASYVETAASATVMWEFNARTDDELSIKEDEVLHILKKDEGAWWKCRNSLGKEGLVPYSYLSMDGVATAVEPSGKADLYRSATAATAFSPFSPSENPDTAAFVESPGGSKFKPIKNLRMPPADKTRTWYDRTGKFKVEAALLGLKDGKLRLHKINGVVIAVPLDKMCSEDRDYVNKSQAQWAQDQAKALAGSKPLAPIMYNPWELKPRVGAQLRDPPRTEVAWDPELDDHRYPSTRGSARNLVPERTPTTGLQLRDPPPSKVPWDPQLDGDRYPSTRDPDPDDRYGMFAPGLQWPPGQRSLSGPTEYRRENLRDEPRSRRAQERETKNDV